MTEAEWLKCPEPKRMLAFRQGKGRLCKRLLYGCACCRLIWPLLTAEDSRQAVAVCERHADGLAAEGEVEASRAAAEAAMRSAQEACTARFQRDLSRRTDRVGWGEPEYCQYRLACVEALAARAACRLLESFGVWHRRSRYATVAKVAADVADAWRSMTWQSPAARRAAHWRMRAALADILRDVFGNPFQPGTSTAAWHVPTVVALAQAAYGDRDFAVLPVLGDALEDAGCTDHQILSHLRGPGPHVRGCHVLDLILSKDR